MDQQTSDEFDDDAVLDDLSSSEEESESDAHISEDEILNREQHVRASLRGSVANWQYLPVEKNIEFVDVEALLFSTASEEIKIICHRLKHYMRNIFPAVPFEKLTPAQLTVIWITQIADMLYQKINEEGNDTHYSKETIVGFIFHECMIMSYGCSPAKYFEFSTPDRFRKPAICSQVSPETYQDILRCLSATKKSNTSTSGTKAMTWEPPLSPNACLQSSQERIRQFCSKIAYVKGISILSKDDDLIRLRSQKVELALGTCRVRNPKKGFGVLHHALVSLLTGLFIGGHIPNISESTLQAVKCIFNALGKASGEVNLEEQMKGKLPNLVTMDRGYQSSVSLRLQPF